MLSFTLSSLAHTLAISTNISQLLFDGYPDPFLQVSSRVPFTQARGIDRFAFFYKENGTAPDGLFEIGTGDQTKFAKVYSWNRKNTSSVYEGQCARIDECLGDFFETNNSRTIIRFFSGELCRVLTLEYVEDEVVEGIVGQKYVIGEYTLDNGTKFPENGCFCSGECVPAGVFNISVCRGGAPFFMSLPHFHRADRYYLHQIDGMAPDPNNHDFSMTIEPTTGIPLKVDAKLQANMLVEKLPGITLFENVPRRYFFPLMWNRYGIKIPSQRASQIKLILDLPELLMIVGVCSVFVSFSLLSIGLGKMYWKRRRRNAKQNVLKLQEQTVPLRKQGELLQ